MFNICFRKCYEELVLIIKHMFMAKYIYKKTYFHLFASILSHNIVYLTTVLSRIYVVSSKLLWFLDASQPTSSLKNTRPDRLNDPKWCMTSE